MGRSIGWAETSITAFVGRARRGPVDEPVEVFSFVEFERIFGSLWAESALAHSVRDFFRLGGSTAVVVRVHQAAPNDVASIVFGDGTSRLTMVASSPGAWGRQLSAVIDDDVTDPDDPTLFNQKVVDGGTGVVERFEDISFARASRRRVDVVLRSSDLVRVSGPLPASALGVFPDSRSAGNGNDGATLGAVNYTTGPGMRGQQRGLYALDRVDQVNLIVVPPYTSSLDVEGQVITDTIAYAAERGAVMIMDPPSAWETVGDAVAGASAPSFPVSSHAAVYFPRLRQPDPTGGHELAAFAPSGAVAGVIAGTDGAVGVWKAPAGNHASVAGVAELSVSMTDDAIAQLNPLGVNCFKAIPNVGHVIWGARTRDGADRLGSQWKYLNVRRTALFIEESIDRGTRWVVFEPNDEPTWSEIRLSVGDFLQSLWRQGALAGASPREAYFVRCDSRTTSRRDIEGGVLNISVGFAPLKPAEFIVLELQQKALTPPKRPRWRRPQLPRIPRFRI